MQLRWVNRRMVIAVAVATAALGAPAWAHPSLAAAETVPLPTDAARSQAYGLVASACASAGNCAAGGFYTNSSFQPQGLLLSENNGSWSASELAFAAGSGFTSGSKPLVTSVACASAGNCVAAGYYFDAMNEQEGFLVSETSGSWGLATDATGASPSSLDAAPTLVPEASCVPGGDCYAIFNTFNGSVYDSLLYANSGGNWTATQVPIPDGGSHIVLSSISCPPHGPCAIVGSYDDAASDVQGLLASTGSLSVATVDTSSLPSIATNPVVTPQAVSCASAGDCTAVGYYEDASDDVQGLLLSSTGGNWSPAVQAQMPGNDYAQGPDLSLNDVACASAGSCEVVGSYDSSSSEAIDGLLVTESGGQWASASEIGLPSAAWNSQPGVVTPAVACPTTGGCLAAGFYQDASNNTQGLLVSQSGAGWTPTVIAFPGGATDPAGTDPTSLACTASGYCVLAGGYQQSSSGAAVLLASPGPTGTPTASAGADHASVTWAAPADNGGMPVTAYRIVANDLTAPSRGGQVVNLVTSDAAVTLPTLTVGDNYTFTVTAINRLGIGLAKTSNTVTVLPSASQLSTSLATLLGPSGRQGKLAAIRKATGYTFNFKSLEAGQVTLDWYGYYTTGLGKHKHQHKALIASATKKIPATLIKIMIRLTPTAKKLLKTYKRLKVTSELSFTAAGQKPIKKSRNFNLW